MQDLPRLTVAILCALLAILQDARGELVSIATWNLEWFPGGKPNSSQTERVAHMGAAKDALLDIRPDILCLQEVRDWGSVAAELVSILPNFQTLVVSRFREMGSSGPLSIQQTAIASNRPAEAAWFESFKASPATPPRGFSFAAIRHGKTVLLVYSVHFKSNIGDDAANIAKREEAARQLLAHVAEMESAYSGSREFRLKDYCVRLDWRCSTSGFRQSLRVLSAPQAARRSGVESAITSKETRKVRLYGSRSAAYCRRAWASNSVASEVARG
jgi:hypothetical protein